MDPHRVFRPKAPEADAAASSAFGAPAAVPESPESFVAPLNYSASSKPSGCSYSSFFRTRCVNGECHEELRRYRQCPGRPKEMAVTDPRTKEERWLPASQAEANDGVSDDSAFSLQVAVPDLKSIWQEVSPQLSDMRDAVEADLQQLTRTIQRDPVFGSMFKEVFKGWPTSYLPRVPGRQHSPPTGDGGSSGGGGGGGDGRSIDITDKQPAPPNTNASIAHSHGSGGLDAVLVSPLHSLSQRLSGWGQKLGELFASASPFDDGRTRQPDQSPPPRPERHE